jgi:hypothetical protein
MSDITCQIPFAQALIRAGKISLLLPQFQQLTVTTKDGQSVPHYLKTIFPLLFCCFALGTIVHSYPGHQQHYDRTSRPSSMKDL